MYIGTLYITLVYCIDDKLNNDYVMCEQIA